jgi:hypothetical protein
VCSDDLWPEDGCHWAGTSCGLHSLMITRSSSYTVFCFYDEGTERLVGVSYFGKVNTCQSLDEAFPPEGFIRGECGNGSFDTPFG